MTGVTIHQYLEGHIFPISALLSKNTTKEESSLLHSRARLSPIFFNHPYQAALSLLFTVIPIYFPKEFKGSICSLLFSSPSLLCPHNSPIRLSSGLVNFFLAEWKLWDKGFPQSSAHLILLDYDPHFPPCLASIAIACDILGTQWFGKIGVNVSYSPKTFD